MKNIMSKLGFGGRDELKKSDPVTDSSPVAIPSQRFQRLNVMAGYDTIDMNQALQFYQNASPVWDAIDRIAMEVSLINPLVYNKKTKKFTNDHPFLELLQHPNTNLTCQEFIKQFASFYLITGNNFSVATGRVNRPPLEVYINNPAEVTIMQDSKDGYAQYYNVNTQPFLVKFTRDAKEFRFYDTENKATATREIYQSKEFQAGRNLSKLWGMSRLQPLSVEIKQYLAAALHNYSLLMRGGRPSLVITSTQPLSDEQYARLQQQINDLISGPNNAGRPFLVEGGGDEALTVTETGQSNKDMDFDKMESRVTNRIYNAYKIPIALISPDSMTLNNLSTALIYLYDNAVLPLTRIIYGELTDFLMRRYDNTGNLILAFDPREIPALSARYIDQINTLSKTNITSVNEMRKVINLEPASPAADLLYQPANLLPVSDTKSKTDPIQPTPPAQPQQPDNTQDITTQSDEQIPSDGNIAAKKYIGGISEEFKQILKQQRDKEGKRLFKDEEIEQIAKEQGLE